ncbi:MAG: ABC transporter permease [Lachnospiraceae bacterium]|nr:ABC transporter permease [Lachnospiraceae bacterium]
MGQFGTLFFYEIKKIMQRKNTWITLGILLTIYMLLTGTRMFGSSYVEGEFLETHKDGFAIDRKNGEKLSGRKLDNDLFDEMKKAYAGMEDKELKYMLTEEYQTKVRPYSTVYEIARFADINPFTVTEKEFYDAREAAVKKSQEKYELTEKEKAYWREQEDRLEKPFTYQYADGYTDLISMNGIYMVCLYTSFLIAICMSSVFTEEHGRKTDQLILCSRLGRKDIYYAKILAGGMFSFLVTAFFLLIETAGVFATYGQEGFSAIMQLFYSVYSYPLTNGQIFLIMTLILLISAVLTGIFTMVLSEITKSNIGSLATVVVILFMARLVPIPVTWRALSQIWNFFPINMLKLDAGFTDMRLISFFGLKLTSWQFAPFLYVLLAVLLVFAGKKVYCRYQVQGR